MTSNAVRTEPHPRRWWILGALCLALLVLVVDNMILNLAIPSLMSELGATPADIQWIIDAYILVFAGLLITSGGLSDRYGRRRFLVIGLAVLGGASAVAMLATEPWHLIGARALMGVGGSILMPSTLSILITVFDETERRKAIAVWSTVSMVGVILGPTLGGTLLEFFWWGSAFAINIPIAVIAIVAAIVIMPESKGDARPVDPLGVILSVVGMSSLVFAVISGPHWGWTSGRTLTAAAVAVVALVAFIIWESRIAHPMLPMDLFKNRNFSGASFTIVLMSFGSGAVLLMLTQYLQFVLGMGPMEAGLGLLPYAISTAVFNAVGATLGQRIPNRPLILAGMAVVAVGFAVLSFLPTSNGYWLMLVALMIMGMGMGMAGPAVYTTLMGAVPPQHAGVGSAVNDTVQQVGAALSVALLGSVLAGIYTANMPGGAPAAARESISGALASGDPGLAEAGRESFVAAMSFGSWVGVGFTIAAVVLGSFLLRRTVAPAAAPTPAESGADAVEQVDKV
ncbi:drug resistance transporter, EmrB/QacA subfamily [Sinosporangium album]|uniref:Drug resistance transporter, EmrB/QacA subfamily n=1 Tax=Sinosporangium album TaxID=504805 RepID=A0A1G7RRD3_9ACTN|nr:MFS transporter [Sinosporangium album]SDG13255.1 drug resistance transporter, EmrB/QacA subfamily [Sinosporangium album]